MRIGAWARWSTPPVRRLRYWLASFETSRTHRFPHLVRICWYLTLTERWLSIAYGVRRRLWHKNPNHAQLRDRRASSNMVDGSCHSR
jgi:hypothetical protein